MRVGRHIRLPAVLAAASPLKPSVPCAARAAGESSYVMHLIRTYNEQAAAKKLRIVPCCGYDSIPSGGPLGGGNEPSPG